MDHATRKFRWATRPARHLESVQPSEFTTIVECGDAHLLGPSLTAASPQTVGVGQADTIAVSLAETNSSSTETFTVTLTDTNGSLSATTGAAGGGGTVNEVNSHDVVISGTLGEVQADLTTLTDTVNTIGTNADTITKFGQHAHAHRKGWKRRRGYSDV